MSCSRSEIDEAVELADQSMPPHGRPEVHDFCVEKLEDLLDKCIEKNIYTEHPAVVERQRFIELLQKKRGKHQELCRTGTVLTLGDLRALTAGLPDSMPLIHTDAHMNSQGLEFYSNRWMYRGSEEGLLEDYCARITKPDK